jgi:putative transposase
MPTGLRRHHGQGDLHFLTFCCYHRRPYLQTALAKSIFLEILAEVRAQFEFQLIGYVLMPEHVHLLLSEPQNATLSTALQVLKQRVSRRLRQRPEPHPSEPSPNSIESFTDARRFWQRRFYDHNVWSSAKKKEKLDYMHANPVNQRLVQHPADWPWSSFSFYANGQPGLIRIDPVD